MLKGRVVIPLAFVGGQNIATTLVHFTLPVHNISNFDSLSITSYFNPIELDGHILIDGGIVRNFPVQDAREMGADVIIGVEVSASLYPKKEINSIIKIMDQISSSQAYISNAEQGNLCDILIKPNIENYSLFSFESIDSLILNGERAARLHLPQLIALADSIRKFGESPKK